MCEDIAMRKAVIVRVTETEFETDGGKIFPHPIPFEKGEAPTPEELQKWYDRCWHMLFGTEQPEIPGGDDVEG